MACTLMSDAPGRRSEVDAKQSVAYDPGAPADALANPNTAVSPISSIAAYTQITRQIIAPASGTTPVPNQLSTGQLADRFGGVATTWDGRVLVWGHGATADGTASKRGWWARVLRPGRITSNADGRPNIEAALGTEANIMPPESAPAYGLDCLNGLAFYPNPAYGQENPYPSDGEGNYNVSGGFETYRAIVVTQKYNKLNTACADLGTQAALQMGQLKARIVIASPRTDNADLYRFDFVDESNQPLAFVPYRTAAGAFLDAYEPTVTLDGQFMVMMNMIGPQAPLMSYSYRQNPHDPNGWSAPKNLLELYGDRNVQLSWYNAAGYPTGSAPLGKRYPLAQQPLLNPDGSAMTGGVFGSYPWISQDGSELTFPGAVSFDGHPRAGLCIVGRLTGWTKKMADGPANPDRFNTRRLFQASPGLMPGMWASFREVRDLVIPASKPKGVLPLDKYFPVYPIFHDHAGYSEITLHEYADRDYIAYFHMNEMLDNIGGYDVTRTPDTSGNFNTGFLTNATGAIGPRFPQEASGGGFPVPRPNAFLAPTTSPYTNPCTAPGVPQGCQVLDFNVGMNGQALYFRHADYIRVPYDNIKFGYGQFRDTFSIEMWVQPIQALTGHGFILLGTLAGVFNLYLGENGAITVQVNQPLTEGGAERWLTLSTAASLVPIEPLNPTWSHVAFTFSRYSQQLNIYVNGSLKAQLRAQDVATSRAGLPPAGAQLYIGPTGARYGTAVPNGLDYLLLDEFAFSRVERTAEEIAFSARRPFKPVYADPTTVPGAPTLPADVSKTDLTIPTGYTPSEAMRNLGQRLFSDVNLSAAGNMACATCHVASNAFFDTQASRPVNNDQPAAVFRSALSLYNRVFSTHLTWDGRVSTLEQQVFLPLLATNEMANTVAGIESYLGSSSSYLDDFQAAFGTRAATADRASKALATYVRSLVSLSAPYDLFRRGNTSALTPAQYRGMKLFEGKARCVGCHSGPDLSDHLFHNINTRAMRTALFPSSPTDHGGRNVVTGRAGFYNAYRTPSLRNLESKPAFFHDGTLTTLEAVVEYYNNGGRPANTTYPDDYFLSVELYPLGLTAEEQADLVEFLRTAL